MFLVNQLRDLGWNILVSSNLLSNQTVECACRIVFGGAMQEEYISVNPVLIDNIISIHPIQFFGLVDSIEDAYLTRGQKLFDY